jgi:hypothetical protein
MNEVIQQNNQVAVVSESSAVLAVIARAASDPTVDMDKLERLLDMQERIMNKQAETEFNSALAAMQADIPSIAERGKSHSGNYATFEDITDIVRPIMKEYGFAISFSFEQSEKNITVIGELVHKGGHSKKTSMILPHDSSGSKNAVQALGSSASYGERYVLKAMLNIATRGADDNGYAAVPFVGLTESQENQIKGLLSRLDMDDQAKFNDLHGALSDIPRTDFDKVYATVMKLLKAVNNANS